MFSLKIHQPHLSFFYAQATPPRPFISSSHLLPPLLSPLSLGTRIFLKPKNFFRSNIPPSKPNFKPLSVSGFDATVGSYGKQSFVFSPQLEDLSQNGDVYQKTLALVECSMFAALSGLVYFLSNSLAIENYFGCFFSLPIVISSMRWGIAGGRKTMVATTMLLLVLSGPVKALTYLVSALNFTSFPPNRLSSCS